MPLTQQELHNILNSSQPLLDGNAREVFLHLLCRIEDLESEVNRRSEAGGRTDKAELERLLDEHAGHHSRLRDGQRVVTKEEKPMVDLLRAVITALPD
jgi:hypothetical protein